MTEKPFAVRRKRNLLCFSFLKCLIIYFVVCGLLTLVCGLLYQEIPWPGYLLTAVPTAAVICYSQGFMTAFLALAVINCITVLPYIFATLADIGKLFIPAVIEVIFTFVQMSHVPAEPFRQQILLGISLCCVFFAANAVFVNYEVKHDLNTLT